MMSTFGKLKAQVRGIFGGELKLSRADGPDPSVEIGGVRATCHRQWPADPRFRARWDGLLARSQWASAFVSPTWQIEGVAASFRPGSMRVITATATGPGELLAVLPMELTPTGFVESAGIAVSDYLDPLASDDHAAIWPAILGLLKEHWDRDLKAVTFHNVRHDWPGKAILAAAASGVGFACEQAEIPPSARLALPDSWDRYLDSLDGHERKELRRKIRKAENEAGARLWVCDATTPSDDVSPCVATALDLLEAADESKRDWLRANVRPFLNRVGTQLVREGRMRLLLLMLNDRPAATLIDLPSPHGPMLYNSGFDPAYRQLSPGVVTFALAIKEAIERKQPFFDMLRGQHPYKYKLGARDEPMYRISVHP
jgi:CelD/BcsL family acetyltransferase involved in cellulose biosynthesis